MMALSQLEIGDLLKIDRGLYMHKGVFAGYYQEGPCVLTNTLEHGERLWTLNAFLNGSTAQVLSNAHLDRWQIQIRIRQVLQSPQGYDLFTRNCEHTVNWVLNGKAESPQVKGWATVAGAVALVLVL